MAIELKGYTPAFENRVYIQSPSTRLIKVGANGTPARETEMEVQRVVLPQRYTQPTEDDVVSHLRGKAEKLRDLFGGTKRELYERILLPPGNVWSAVQTPLEVALMGIPDSVLRDLEKRHEGLAAFLRNSTTAPRAGSDKAHASYMGLRYGLLPTTLIHENGQIGNINDEGWYIPLFFSGLSSNEGLQKCREELSKYRLGEQWTINLLLKDGALPTKNAQFLLDINQRESFGPDEVNKLLAVLYEKPPTPIDIQQLFDASADVLEKHALEAIVALKEYLSDKSQTVKTERQLQVV